MYKYKELSFGLIRGNNTFSVVLFLTNFFQEDFKNISILHFYIFKLFSNLTFFISSAAENRRRKSSTHADTPSSNNHSS